MKKIFVLIFIFYLGCISILRCESKISHFSNWSLSKNDSVLFNYNSFGNDIQLEPIKLKFYRDTLFVYKMEIYSIEEEIFGYVMCQKIYNQDTINVIKEFIRLFITEKKEKIIMYPEREFNPIFLQLCDLFYSAALQLPP
jgi:hypothetical protein